MSTPEEFRFFQEAEFVQCLANVDYVLWLSKQGFFQKPEFINFLEYLQYFALPEYSIHLTYGKGVQILSLLLNPKVRDTLSADPLAFRRIILDQLWACWGRTTECAQVVET